MSQPRLVLPLLLICLATAPTPTARAEDPPTTAQDPAAHSAAAARPAGDVERLFRFHAGAQAQVLRDAVERASFAETLRDELRLLVREHLRRVDEGAAGAASGKLGAAPLDDLIDRAAGLARDFNDRQVAGWLDEHPSAYQPVQEQISLAEAYERATADEPDALVRAARAAGLPQEREADLRRVVTEAHKRLASAAEADARRLREAEEKAAAAAPPVDRQSARQSDRPAAPPADIPTSFPRRVDGTAAPRAVAPPPPATAQLRLSPEAEKLQLLDALAFADAHARVAAAAREVRAEVEKHFPQPPQRKALDDEMLRWYQTYVPPEDAGGTDPPPGTRRKPSPAGDPGF